ncbi:phage portal protein, partial [Oceanospirillum multiglobuliferum]
GKLRFKVVSPKNCFIVHSMDLDEEPLAAVYYNQFLDPQGKGYTRIYEVFTKDEKWSFTTETDDKPDSKVRIKNFDSNPNALKTFPVTELVANEERIGDFEAQISLIDAYNLAVSDSVNDIAYWNDAYLWLQGFDISED